MDAILERDVDLVIHSGDVFDSVRPATHVIIGFLKQTFRITRQDIPYLVAAGNHETPRLRSTTAALEYANLVNAISAHGFDDRVPRRRYRRHQRRGNARSARRCVRDGRGDAGARRGREHTRDARDWCQASRRASTRWARRTCSRGCWRAASTTSPSATTTTSTSTNRTPSMPGATERFGFGEVESRPGFAIVEFDGTGLKGVEHVEIEARPMLDLKKISAREMDAAELTEEVRKRTSEVDLDGAIVRLQGLRRAPRGGQRHGPGAAARPATPVPELLLGIHAEERPEDLERNGSQTAVFGPLGEEFAAFVSERKERGELEAKFAEEFLEKGRAYLTRAASEEPGARRERRVILERLFIENYKQLRDPMELYPPEGAIGIVGANGAGKSTLFESILWAFFGSRGGGPRFANESIPWSGGTTKDPTTVEVTLATDGGSFTVRRRLKSGSTTAEALDAQGRTVVSGTADVTRWVEENLLGMDRTAFEATFYARQKELRFFAHDEGISRVRKISRLLGISSVETAQSFLREDRNTSAPKRGSSKAASPKPTSTPSRPNWRTPARSANAWRPSSRRSQKSTTPPKGISNPPAKSARPGGHLPRALAPHVRPARGRG